jgi:hypothetical protein
MPSLRRVTDWVGILSSLFPIEGLVLVGAGFSSELGRFAKLKPPSVVFIEADESTHKKLESTIREHDAWVAHRALVAERDGEAIFYGASNPSESGLIEPSSLTKIWRNLKTKNQERRVATTLDRLLKDETSPGGKANWIVVDCLPAVSILSGALASLEKSDVVVTRAILDPAILTLPGANRNEVESFLSERGFRCVSVEGEHHPAVGHLIFVRDWRALATVQIEALRADLGRRDRVHAELAVSFDALQVERNDQAVLAAAWQRQLEETTAARDFKSQLAAERQDLADQLAKTNHENLQHANQLGTRLDEVSQQRDKALQDASKYFESVERLNESLDGQRSLAEQRLRDLQASIAKCEVETNLAAERHSLNEQLVRTSDENLRLADELRVQLDKLARERDSAVHDLARCARSIEQLTTERDVQIDLVNQRQQQLEEALVGSERQAQLGAEQRQIADQLATRFDERSRELGELQPKLEQARATIQDRANRVNVLESERNELEARLAKAQEETQERSSRVDALEAERGELQARQVRLDQEMLKAEAQIELIKDVILREKAF